MTSGGTPSGLWEPSARARLARINAACDKWHMGRKQACDLSRDGTEGTAAKQQWPSTDCYHFCLPVTISIWVIYLNSTTVLSLARRVELGVELQFLRRNKGCGFFASAAQWRWLGTVVRSSRKCVTLKAQTPQNELVPPSVAQLEQPCFKLSQ